MRDEKVSRRSGQTSVLFSKTKKKKEKVDEVRDYSQLGMAMQTFKSGSSALKALEQTHIFSDGLIMREDEEDEENNND